MTAHRQSIPPTYDSRETGPRYNVTTWLCDRVVAFRQPLDDPFVSCTVTLAWRDVLRCLLRGRRPAVCVVVDGDHDVVEDVLDLDSNRLGLNCTRRDEFTAALFAGRESL